MILVATGTTGFDALVCEMDRLAPALAQPVVMQIGDGRYVPQQCDYFRLAPSLQPYYQQATLVVAHGGMGICLEVLEAGKPLIALSNPDRYDQHQDDLLRTLEAQTYLIWCREVAGLEQALVRAPQVTFRPYQRPECTVHLRIRELLNQRRDAAAGALRRRPRRAA
jgi:beta-1,4-N-acetylglucosaminyltransferase